MGCSVLKCTCGKKSYLPQRYVLAIMSLSSLLVGYGQRVSLNLAITVMTPKNASATEECPPRNSSVDRTNINISGGVIDWTNKQQNVVLGAFYPGYVIGHIPAGIMSDKFGGRYVLGGGMFVSTLMTLLTPVVVLYTPFWVTIILRNLMGLGQAVVFPAMSCLYAHWVPKEERSTLGSFSFAAASLGSICGSLFTGWIIRLAANWPVGFYIWALQGTVWCIIFMIYVYSSPKTSPRITEREKVFLEARLQSSKKKPKIPWFSFAKDLPLWVLLFATMGHMFSLFTLVNSFPKYLRDVQRFGLGEISLATSFPYGTQWISGVITGKVIDYLIKKKGASLLWCRRIATTIGSTVSGACLVGCGYVGCDGGWVIAFFCLSLLTKGAIYSGIRLNHLDMSVNFAGILMALVNGLSAITGWISPEVINAVAKDNTLAQWKLMFWITFIVSAGTNLLYMFCSVASRRKWDFDKSEMDAFNKAVEEEKAEKQRKKDEKRKKKEDQQNKKEEDKKDQPGISA